MTYPNELKKVRLHFLFLIFSLTFCLPSQAQWLKRPLRFAPADSVMTWGYDGRDFRTLAIMTDSTVTMPRLGVSRETWKGRKKLWADWKADEKEANVVGGAGNPLTEPQAMSALSNLTRGARLFLMQGDAAFADHYERAIYNAAQHVAADTTQMPGTWEKFAAAQMLAATPGLMYATSSDGDLYVNLYTNATAVLHVGDVRLKLDQITDMPLNGAVRLRLMALKEPTRLCIRLRMPDWTGVRPETTFAFSGGEKLVPSVFVNGHEWENATPNEKGYVVIDRKWRSMDEVYIDFPLRAQFVRARAALPKDVAAPIRDKATLQWGPLTYFITTPTQGCYFPLKDTPNVSSTLDAGGYPVLEGTMFRYEGTPQGAQAPAEPYTAYPFSHLVVPATP